MVRETPLTAPVVTPNTYYHTTDKSHHGFIDERGTEGVI